MSSPLQRITDAITEGRDDRIQSLTVLLHLVEHLQRTKGASLGEIHAAVALVYMNMNQAKDDALHTYVTGTTHTPESEVK